MNRNNNEDEFCKMFSENIRRRAKNHTPHLSIAERSEAQKPLRIDGAELARQKHQNTERLAKDVWQCAIWSRERGEVSASTIRTLVERWYDIANHDLVNNAAYAEDDANMREMEKRIAEWDDSIQIGSFSHRYRVWPTPHTSLNIHPVLLDREMGRFYERLSGDMREALNVRKHVERLCDMNELTAQIMAYADCVMEGELHPWRAGSSRMATAVLLWITTAIGYEKPPMFALHADVHNATIRNVGRHAKYFREKIFFAAQKTTA